MTEGIVLNATSRNYLSMLWPKINFHVEASAVTMPAPVILDGAHDKVHDKLMVVHNPR